jgi:hypothetical protein
MNLTPAQLDILHTKPHNTQLNLSIFQPRVVFKAKINNPSAQNGDRIIPYNTVSLGAISAIEAGMTLYVGTTDEARDVGIIRIRSVDGSQFIVSENNNINWQNGLFLTVVRYFDLWPVYPRIIQDPANSVNVIFYKDYDIAYVNQNSILGTFPNAGPHRAAFLDPTQAQIYYTASGSLNLAGASLSYDWNFEGGTPSGSNLLTPGLVNYNTPGHYVTRLIISGSNGAIDSTYRCVSIYDRPGNGTGTVPARWEFAKVPDGSRSEGGYTATIRMYDVSADLAEDSVVIVFTDDYYGSNKISLGGNAQNSASIFFVGYILKNSIKYDYANSFVEFEIGSLTELMKQSLGFAISIQDDLSPDTWYKILNLNVKEALYHFLRWHTTALSIADFQFLGQDYPIQYFDSTRESMYDAINDLMKSTLVGQVVSDRQGKIWAEVAAEATPNATGTFTQVMELQKQDWMNQPVLQENIRNLYSYLEYGGIAYSGLSTGTYTPLMANAPGSAPSFMGKVDNTEGLALLGQLQLNQLVGNLWTNRNARFPRLDADLSGKYSNLDIAPIETVHIVLQPSDTARRIQIEQLYNIEGMTWQWDEDSQILYPSTTFTTIKSGNPGQTIIIPQVPDSGGYGGSGRFKAPAFPVIPSLSFPAISTGTASYLRVLASGNPSALSPYGILNWSYQFGSAPTGTVGGDYTVLPAGVTINTPGIYDLDFWALTTMALPPTDPRNQYVRLQLGGLIDSLDRAHSWGFQAVPPYNDQSTESHSLHFGGIYSIPSPTTLSLSLVFSFPTLNAYISIMSIRRRQS